MQTSNRLLHPLDYCAAGLAGLFLWAAPAAVAQQPLNRAVAYNSPAPPVNLPPAPSPALLGAMANTPAAKVSVADVVVTGNHVTPTPTVMTYIKTRPGFAYDAALVQEDARNLVATGLFASVSVQIVNVADGKVNVVFQLRDRPTTIQKIEYR